MFAYERQKLVLSPLEGTVMRMFDAAALWCMPKEVHLTPCVYNATRFIDGK